MEPEGYPLVHMSVPFIPIRSQKNAVHFHHPVSWRSILVLFSDLWLGPFCRFPTKTLIFIYIFHLFSSISISNILS